MVTIALFWSIPLELCFSTWQQYRTNDGGQLEHSSSPEFTKNATCWLLPSFEAITQRPKDILCTLVHKLFFVGITIYQIDGGVWSFFFRKCQNFKCSVCLFMKGCLSFCSQVLENDLVTTIMDKLWEHKDTPDSMYYRVKVLRHHQTTVLFYMRGIDQWSVSGPDRAT